MNLNIAFYPIIGFGVAVNYYASDGIQYDQNIDDFVTDGTERTLQLFLGFFVLELVWFDD
jgi:hypothetical protein